jgi:hypothetical protein
MWWQDVATAHMTRIKMQLLLGEIFIWPSRSAGLDSFSGT